MDNIWEQLADKETIDRTIKALKENGFEAEFVETKEEAKRKVLSIIPKGAEVLTMTSITLETLDLPKDINDSGKYNSVRNKLNSMDRATQNLEMQKMGAAPDWAVGSVHAVTEDGHVLIASNTGSQLSAYVGGSPNVVWIVGAQKIVKNTEEAIKRAYDHSLPLESDRARKAYGVEGSSVNKILIIKREVKPGRITLILVNEKLGF